MADVHQYYTVYHDEDDRSVDSWTGPLALKSIAGRCRCGWRGQRRPDTAESGVLAFNEWWSEHYTPLVRPDPGELLILSNEGGERRHFLAGRPVHTAMIIELLLSGGHWVPVRYEWSARADAAPRFYVELGGPWEAVDEHGPETYLLVPLERAVFRWPGTTAGPAQPAVHSSELEQPSAEPAGTSSLPDYGSRFELDSADSSARIGPLGGPILPDPPGYDIRDTGTFPAITPLSGSSVFDETQPALPALGSIDGGGSPTDHAPGVASHTGDYGLGDRYGSRDRLGNGLGGNGSTANGLSGGVGGGGLTGDGSGDLGPWDAPGDPTAKGAVRAAGSGLDAGTSDLGGYGSTAAGYGADAYGGGYGNRYDDLAGDGLAVRGYGGTSAGADSRPGGGGDYDLGSRNGERSTYADLKANPAYGGSPNGDYGLGEYGTGSGGDRTPVPYRSGGDNTPAPLSGGYYGAGRHDETGYGATPPGSATAKGAQEPPSTGGLSPNGYDMGGYGGGYGSGDSTGDFRRDSTGDLSGDLGLGGLGAGDRASGERGTAGLGAGGDYGSGGRSGDDFSRERGAADYSTGDLSADSYGTGDYGTGDYGTGDYGTGDYGTGDYGTGDYSTGDYGSGRLSGPEPGTGSYAPGDLGAPERGSTADDTGQYGDSAGYGSSAYGTAGNRDGDYGTADGVGYQTAAYGAGDGRSADPGTNGYSASGHGASGVSDTGYPANRHDGGGYDGDPQGANGYGEGGYGATGYGNGLSNNGLSNNGLSGDSRSNGQSPNRYGVNGYGGSASSDGGYGTEADGTGAYGGLSGYGGGASPDDGAEPASKPAGYGGLGAEERQTGATPAGSQAGDRRGDAGADATAYGAGTNGATGYGAAGGARDDGGATEGPADEPAEGRPLGGAFDEPLVDPFNRLFNERDGRSLNRRLGKPLPGNWGDR